MPDDQKESRDTEKGFGTGLRAQLERRREADDDGSNEPARHSVELRLVLTARPRFEGTADDGALGDLRADLAAAHAREAELRSLLEEREQAYHRGVGSEQDLARRAATVDERDAKLAEFQSELEERERRVRNEREAIEQEHRRGAGPPAGGGGGRGGVPGEG